MCSGSRRVTPQSASGGFGNGWKRSCSKSSRRFRYRMHEPVAQMGEWLGRLLNGFHQYHAVPGNCAILFRFRAPLSRCWLHV